MALVDCAECGKQLSTLAAACPHCGAPAEVARPAPRVQQAPRTPPKPSETRPSSNKQLLLGVGVVLASIAAYVLLADKQLVDGPESRVGASLKAQCIQQRTERTAEFDKLMSEKNFDGAWTLAFNCVLADEPYYAALRNKATVGGNLEKLKTTSLSPEQRLNVIQELQELAPALAPPFEKELPKLREAARKERAADEAAARNRPREPYIGMRESEASNLTWGSPSTVNTDRSARGVSEQWVFPNRGYLYFRNGVLEAIQERP